MAGSHACQQWHRVLRGVLQDSKVEGLLGNTFCEQILRTEEHPSLPCKICGWEPHDDVKEKTSIVLHRPYSYTLAQELIRGAQLGFTGYKDPDDPALTKLQLPFASDMVSAWNGGFSSLKPSLATFDENSLKETMTDVIQKLGQIGIRALLGLRYTSGSVLTCFPPSCVELTNAFEAIHRDQESEEFVLSDGEIEEIQAEVEKLRLEIKQKPGDCEILEKLKQLRGKERKHIAAVKTNGKLTVGARALSKHALRGKEMYWTEGQEPTGPPRHINKLGILALEKVMKNAVWGNTHQLPGDLITHEIRTQQGYGLRWCLEDEEEQDTGEKEFARPHEVRFRGFLEPHSVDGHATGWKH
eukprot:m.343741 g.343741  ORF g.343741 m.343741 type:complete len:356 (+) comp23239_c0_seq1:159-1226(+)